MKDQIRLAFEELQLQHEASKMNRKIDWKAQENSFFSQTKSK